MKDLEITEVMPEKPTAIYFVLEIVDEVREAHRDCNKKVAPFFNFKQCSGHYLTEASAIKHSHPGEFIFKQPIEFVGQVKKVMEK